MCKISYSIKKKTLYGGQGGISEIKFNIKYI
jgi:hypothetical protein